MSTDAALPISRHDQCEQTPMLAGLPISSSNKQSIECHCQVLTSHSNRPVPSPTKTRRKLLYSSSVIMLVLIIGVCWILWRILRDKNVKPQIHDYSLTSQILSTESSSVPSTSSESSSETVSPTIESSSTSSTTLFLHHMTDVPLTTESTKRNLRKKVLFIVADGIPADVLENVPVLNMRRIQNIGAYTRAFVGGIKGTYSQTATISSPGYMSLLTGTWGNKHNVYDNYVRKPNYNYKNVFRLVKEQDPTRTIAIFSTWTTNRIKLIGEGLHEAGNITFDYKFDGYELDRISYPHDRQSVYIRNIDQRVAEEAEHCIKSNAPDLSWVYLQYTDDVGHYFGDSDAFNQSILLLDERIGQIWEAIDYRISHYQEDWLLIITTDHGRDPKKGKHHAGQSPRERTTWIVTNSRETNSYFYNSQPAIVDVLPTILRFLNLTIPVDDERELDGIPFIGGVSLMNPKVTLQNSSLTINWTVLEATGNVKVWLSTTNQFKKGKTDNYTLVATVPTDRGAAIIDIGKNPSQFYKVLLEGQYNMVNQWIYRPQLKLTKSRVI